MENTFKKIKDNIDGEMLMFCVVILSAVALAFILKR